MAIARREYVRQQKMKFSLSPIELPSFAGASGFLHLGPLLLCDWVSINSSLGYRRFDNECVLSLYHANKRRHTYL
jgi:hypothetical protein